MSDVSQGPGWWLASDGRWYAPELHPAFVPPPPPAGDPSGYTYPPPAAASSTNGLAIASMVLGILWIYAIGSVLALVFGYKAKRSIDQSGGRESGRGMAIAGIVLGWIGVVCTTLLAIVLIVGISSGAFSDFDSDPHDGICNDQRFWQDPDC
jgi:hypothetical protein